MRFLISLEGLSLRGVSLSRRPTRLQADIFKAVSTREGALPSFPLLVGWEGVLVLQVRFSCVVARKVCLARCRQGILGLALGRHIIAVVICGYDSTLLPLESLENFMFGVFM